MSDPFLILHKVRGEPAFDIAIKMPCPSCQPGVEIADESMSGCDLCDGLNVLWIIPTSGHRAHPYWYIAVNDLYPKELAQMDSDIDYGLTEDTIGEAFTAGRMAMPSPWPDHYPSRSGDAPKINLSSIVAALAPQEPVERRF